MHFGVTPDKHGPARRRAGLLVVIAIGLFIALTVIVGAYALAYELDARLTGIAPSPAVSER